MTDDLKEPVYDTSERNARIEWEHNTVYCTDALRWAKHRIEQLEADTKEVNAARIYLREQGRLLRGLAEARTGYDELLAHVERLREELENMCRSVLNECSVWAQFNTLFKDFEKAVAATPEQSLDALLDSLHRGFL